MASPEAATDSPVPSLEAWTPPGPTPQLVKRVHQLYEQLGREEVQAVEDMERGGRDLQPQKSGPK
jgi:H+-transporting ATPase